MQHPKLGTLESTYADTILHVVNHGTYHRGNVTAMLRQLGHSGVPTDYMYYLYEKRETPGEQSPGVIMPYFTNQAVTESR